MVHVGKKQLEQNIQFRIEKELLDFITHPKRSISKSLMLELLTDSERLMLAKRFAAVLLLADDTSYYFITDMLGMSTSTSKRLHQKLLNGDFSGIEEYVGTKKNKEEHMKRIGKILRGGLPPRAYILKKPKVRKGGK